MDTLQIQHVVHWGSNPSEDKAKPTVTNDPWRKSTTWEPLQHTRTEHSGRVQQQVKFKTTSTKFQEHATNKHVMILSYKGVSYGIAISQTLFTAPSLDHRCTLVQVTYNTFKSSITSCKNIPKRSSEKLSTSWTAQPWQLWKLLHTSSNESTCVQLLASDIKLGSENSYAWTAALCDLGDPGWGDPWFPHWALLLPSPSYLAPLYVSVFSLFCFLFGGHSQWHTRCHHACYSHCW